MKKIRKPSQKRVQFTKNILDIIGPIISDGDFKKLKTIRHHIFFNRYEHLLNVAKMCYKLAKFFKADIQVCTLAGLLHDYHHTFIKDHRHAVMACENSKRFNVPAEALSIVKTHMYPLGRKTIGRAKGKNFWIVKFADCVAPIMEILYSILAFKLKYENIIKFKTNQLLLDMLVQEEDLQVVTL